MNTPISRRKFVSGTALVAGAASLPNLLRAQTIVRPSQPLDGSPLWTKPPLGPGTDYRPTVTLNGSTLPFRVVDGVKVFHLTSAEVDHIFVPETKDNGQLRALCWGYNGQVHGPTIECVEGDRVRIYVTNKLPEATTVHWHGMIVPSGMDGVGGLSQKAIRPGETFKYEFTTWQVGTFMYHSHHDEMTQMALGLSGMVVIHPRQPENPVPDRDYVILLSEWRIDPGTYRPNANEMTEFNILTMNGRSFPGTAPLLARQGERVRIRLGNLGAMDHHSMHLHGHAWEVVDSGEGPIPSAGRWPTGTVLVPVGGTATMDFIANNPGDWAFHCHMTHHVMNQMGHGIPNIVGIETTKLDERGRKLVPGYMTMGADGTADMGEMSMGVPPNSVPMVGAPGPFDYITMGGMYTNLKVRENLGDLRPELGKDFLYGGWYENPPGTQAMPATAEELQRDFGQTKPA